MLQLQIVGELLLHVLAHVERAELAHAGHSLEKQDALDQDLGVAHLTDGLLFYERPELAVAPVVTHLCVDDVLMDGCELSLEHAVEMFDDLGIALHSPIIEDASGASGARNCEGVGSL